MLSPLQDQFHHYLLDTSGNPYFRPWNPWWIWFRYELVDWLWEIRDDAIRLDLSFIALTITRLIGWIPLDPGDYVEE